MGHSEMILAVAGNSEEEVDLITRRLAGDGSALPEEDRAVLELARKQAQHPASVTDADLADLEQKLGRDKAWQAVWWAARCHDMTRVADAFQFPLERENPFRAMPGARKQE